MGIVRYENHTLSINNQIFVSCVNGIVKCYREPKDADQIPSIIPCPERVTRSRQLGSTVPAIKLWPDAKVCYKFDEKPTFDPIQMQMIYKTMPIYQDISEKLQQC